MNRTIFTIAGVFSASSLLLADSAVKGTALLVLAAIAVMILRRDSAATRHLVWLLAIVALLVVPLLSAMLPQWRVLPEWAGISPEPVAAATSPPAIARPAEVPLNCRRLRRPVEVEQSSAIAYQPAADCRIHGPRWWRRQSIPSRPLELELDQRTATRVGHWFFRAHPAADGRSLDALEFRTARDGHWSSRQRRRQLTIPS